jgi:hypothetical protein
MHHMPHRYGRARVWKSIVEYDVTTFAARGTLKVPRRLLTDPAYLRINAKGEMLFLPANGGKWGSGEMTAAGGVRSTRPQAARDHDPGGSAVDAFLR